MISKRSIQNFCFVNTFLVAISFSQYSAIIWCEKIQCMYFLAVLWCASVLRNYILLYFLEYATRHKKAIDPHHSPIEAYPYEFHVNVWTASLVESGTHLYMHRYMYMFTHITPSLGSFIVFIPLSFVFEVVFDFFHYITHRALHHPYFYKYLHKKHHTFQHPTAITTFYQDPFDLLITNSFPTMTAFLILSPIVSISHFQFHMMVVYKSYLEIGGHLGKQAYPSCCFHQCKWLPQWLCIELYTEDHDYHHSRNHCNYGKRFSLWDKVFGTYVPYINSNRIQ